MAFYEGRRGDFFLSEFSCCSDGKPIELNRPSISYGKISVGSGSADASNVMDGNGSTGWSTSDRQGQGKPPGRSILPNRFAATEPWTIELLFERHFAAALGHFRISVTDREGRRDRVAHERGAGVAIERMPGRAQVGLDQTCTRINYGDHYVQNSDLIETATQTDRQIA